MIDLQRLRKSFSHALRGVRTVFRTEQSFRIQIIMAILVLILAFWLGVTSFEYIVLLLLIGSILSLELINSVFERIVDAFKPRIHPIVKDIKDIMAATVFITSIIALFVGVTIFYPYISALVLR